MKTTLTLIAGLILGAGAMSITYKTVGITETAYNKVVGYAKTHDLSYRDAVSLMVMEYKATPFIGYDYEVKYPEMTCWMNKEEYDLYLDNKKLIAQGITVYEVIEGARCIIK